MTTAVSEQFVPIITSLLDLDFYKPNMAQFVFHRYRSVRVKFALNNRTSKVRLADVIPIYELRRQLEHVRTLRFQDEEIGFLAGIKRRTGAPMYQEDFLSHLKRIKLGRFSLKVRDGQFSLYFKGPWHKVIFWETIALSIINELYYRYTVDDMEAAKEEGRRRLEAKIDELLAASFTGKIIEFGTRRRFSREWQEEVTRTLRDRIPEILAGTSNVYLAMKLGIRPSGTMAHELFMVIAALLSMNDTSLRASHNRVLREWWDEYGPELSVALTDTFGTDFFFADFAADQAELWLGLRQDSGDPHEFGEKATAFYQNLCIDTREKTLVFSDGLEIDTILSLWKSFPLFITVFGWGTNLTNDLGYQALSLVIKAVAVYLWIANRQQIRGTVKLSDNLAKAQGSPEDIERYSRVFTYSSRFSQATRY